VLGGGSLLELGQRASTSNSTIRSATVWRGRQQQHHADTTFQRVRDLRQAAQGYSVLSGARWRTREQQTLAQVVCPLGSFPLSGGALSSSSDRRRPHSTSPDGAGWDVYEDTHGADQRLDDHAFVVCAA